jgi:hypothetical protein
MPTFQFRLEQRCTTCTTATGAIEADDLAAAKERLVSYMDHARTLEGNALENLPLEAREVDYDDYDDVDAIELVELCEVTSQPDPSEANQLAIFPQG